MTGPSLLLRCGCDVAFRDGQNPTCPVHGVQAVARVLRMPAPRFTGHVTGPHATPQDLAPSVDRFVTKESS